MSKPVNPYASLGLSMANPKLPAPSTRRLNRRSWMALLDAKTTEDMKAYKVTFGSKIFIHSTLERFGCVGLKQLAQAFAGFVKLPNPEEDNEDWTAAESRKLFEDSVERCNIAGDQDKALTPEEARRVFLLAVVQLWPDCYEWMSEDERGILGTSIVHV